MLTLALLLAFADPAIDEAKADFERGTSHYNLGEFNEALADYKEAYRLSKLPAFLFNIGQCYYALADYEKAAFFYEGFLRESPTSEHRKEVEGFLADAKRLLAEQRAKAAATTTSPESAKPPPPVTSTSPPPTPPKLAPPLTAPAATSQPAAAADDAPWFWPTVIGGGAVVAAAVGTTIAIVALSQGPHGKLPTIDARNEGNHG